MIKNFCRHLVYKDFKLTLLSNTLHIETLSCSINLRMRLFRASILSVLHSPQRCHPDKQ